MEPAVILLATIALVAVAGPFWLRSRSRHLQAVAQHLDVLTRDGEMLIRDPSVPESTAKFVWLCMDYAISPMISRRLVWDILTGRAYNSRDDVDSVQEFEHDLHRLSDPQAAIFNRFMGHVMLCSASSDPLLAIFTRRFLLWGLTGSFRHGAKEGARLIGDDVAAEPEVAIETVATMPRVRRELAAVAA